MLTVYTRHSSRCLQADSMAHDCECPKWIRGVLPAHGRIRVSARTRSLQEAEDRLRKMEQTDASEVSSVEQAIKIYLAEQEARRLSKSSLRQSRGFLERQFLPWLKNRGLMRLDEIRTWGLRELQHTWNLRALTATRRHERLRAFFRFCVVNGWLRANPMDGLKKPIVLRARPTDYFNRREFERILMATQEYEYGGGRDCAYRSQRMRALVLLMRWSGLSIKDAVMLERRSLDSRGALFLRRAKTGLPVFVPLPPLVVSSLNLIPPLSSAYFFWSGKGDARSAVQGYERSFRKLFRIADIRHPDGNRKPCRSHMFRDTFAVELLLAGVPVDQVSILLGHCTIKMTEKHYLPWVQARQKQLTKSVRRAWFPKVRSTRTFPVSESHERSSIGARLHRSFRMGEFYGGANARRMEQLLPYL